MSSAFNIGRSRTGALPSEQPWPPASSCLQEKRVIGSAKAARMTNRPRPTLLAEPLFQGKGIKTSPIHQYDRLFGITTILCTIAQQS